MVFNQEQKRAQIGKTRNETKRVDPEGLRKSVQGSSIFVMLKKNQIKVNLYLLLIKHLHTCVLSHIQLFATPSSCSLPGSSVHGIIPSGILEWVVISSSRGSSQPNCLLCWQADSLPLSHLGSPIKHLVHLKYTFYHYFKNNFHHDILSLCEYHFPQTLSADESQKCQVQHK